jgi:hypothetical protein
MTVFGFFMGTNLSQWITAAWGGTRLTSRRRTRTLGFHRSFSGVPFAGNAETRTGVRPRTGGPKESYDSNVAERQQESASNDRIDDPQEPPETPQI